MTATLLHVNDRQFSQMIEKLGQLVAIPSVSNISSPDYSSQNLDNAAHFLVKEFEELGFDVKCQRINNSPLFITGSKVTDSTKPTVLIYGHYDVQPVDRDHWDSDPFRMIEKKGRLYGRGISDDKAGIFVILAALKVFKEAEKNPIFNLKILIEGEEEFGASNMGSLLKKEHANLASDVLIVIDGVNKGEDIGTLESSTRGVLTMTLKVEALEKPVHSGMCCLAPDPAQALAGLIYSLRNPREIKGFMDDCLYTSDEEISLLAKNSQSEEEHKRKLGVVAGGGLRGDPKLSVYQRILEEPSISILNMNSGQPGGGNSIQSSAECTIGVRLTAGQNPAKIEQVLRDHLTSQSVLYNLPFTFSRAGLSADAWKTDASKFYATKYLKAMQTCYPYIEVVPTGATIPFLSDFQAVFPKTERFIVGIEDPETAAHSHNESQSIAVFRRAIDSLIAFLDFQ